jgi:hypothetical protein
MTPLMAHSPITSIWGWYAMDISSFTPIRWCNSRQNLEMNLGSQSNTIDSGYLCNRMISLRNSQATSKAFTVVTMGIRWTKDVNQHITTNK